MMLEGLMGGMTLRERTSIGDRSFKVSSHSEVYSEIFVEILEYIGGKFLELKYMVAHYLLGD